MTRCIEADSVRDEILYGEAYVSAELEVYIKKVFDDAPAADVAPVVHGRWKGAGMGDYYCSLCCEEVSGNRHKFCPNCGAKMDLED